MKKVLCLILSLALIIVTNPVSTLAAHSHSASCYNGTCHSHVSTCESRYNSKSGIGNNYVEVTCALCKGDYTFASDSRATVCGGSWSQRQNTTYSTSMGASGNYSNYCSKCGYVKSTGGSWSAGVGSSGSYNPPSLPEGTCTNKILKCPGTMRAAGSGGGTTGDGVSYGSSTSKCDVCCYVAEYAGGNSLNGSWTKPEYNPGKACIRIYYKCPCNSGKQYVNYTCGVDTTKYYDTNGNEVSTSCNKVVKVLSTKK